MVRGCEWAARWIDQDNVRAASFSTSHRSRAPMFHFPRRKSRILGVSHYPPCWTEYVFLHILYKIAAHELVCEGKHEFSGGWKGSFSWTFLSQLLLDDKQNRVLNANSFLYSMMFPRINSWLSYSKQLLLAVQTNGTQPANHNVSWWTYQHINSKIEYIRLLLYNV